MEARHETAVYNTPRESTILIAVGFVLGIAFFFLWAYHRTEIRDDGDLVEKKVELRSAGFSCPDNSSRYGPADKNLCLADPWGADGFICRSTRDATTCRIRGCSWSDADVECSK